ncbi:diguanylate phosphodiesterase [Candidatus Pantoea deserta]|uniref:Diguanylate phosphodiesterase n=1 Tax=Candidatus Pantoea deserta TaxID=1869313 RepID=A0A3N4NNC7_9GAMM|nr:diguanylate phosphodiesterase [Pantoea deserta]RPD94646.1 diguanylate phosphodiesterase [Pantoea deserta]
MLTTIIYRSHLSDDVPVKTLDNLATDANKINETFDVTGILLFDGTHFFQLLEGSDEAVRAIYERICADKRHHNLVELMYDYSPSRRFGNVGMELFDLRKYDKETVLQAVLDKGTTKYQLTYDDRALQFLRTFVEAREKGNYFEIPAIDTWDFVVEDSQQKTIAPPDAADCSFAFQPIIDPLMQQIVSLEALIRTPDGGAPGDYFAQFTGEAIYAADIKAKGVAFAQAKALNIQGQTLSVNLLPMSLVMVPNAVEQLLNEIHQNGLVPEQIVVEVTENEVISRLDEFTIAVKKLRAAGISIALDDFGAGFAGLSLLSRFQPDKVKIDRNLITDVHKSGPKQAIVHAILKCCSSLEISVIAEGIEKPEEWMWLEAAGISLFQGYLFARPHLNGIPPVAWPEIQ